MLYFSKEVICCSFETTVSEFKNVSQVKREM